MQSLARARKDIPSNGAVLGAVDVPITEARYSVNSKLLLSLNLRLWMHSPFWLSLLRH